MLKGGMITMYRCPVCYQKLFFDNNVYRCINNHNYDISSKGYVNLLLANQKHSINPGDSKEMILSRVNFLKLDYYSFLRETILNTILKYFLNNNLLFADLACGEGYYTNYLHSQLSLKKNVITYGIDISKYAIIEACKKKKEFHLENINYCVGNLMNLPFLDQSFDCLLNCFALFEQKEFLRVLKDKGLFIRILPDTYHLYELKKYLYDNVILNETKEKNVLGLKLLDEIHIHQDIFLKNYQEIYNLFTMTPYYYKSKKESIDKLAKLKSLQVRADFILLIYQKCL